MGLKSFLSPFTLLLVSFLVSAATAEYGTNGSAAAPVYSTGEMMLPTLYGVQGLIYCGSCYDFTPIQGAVAKISCEAEGYMPETFSILSPKTDENGYLLATFTPEQLGSGLKPSDCKVVLESSPSPSCKIATNTNLGKTGVPLTYSRNLDGYMRAYTLELYSIPAFVYTTKAKCEKPNYYKVPLYTPKPSYKPMTYTPESTNKKVPTIYGVQGIIYCGSCYDLTPIEGGVAKISCKADGYKTATFSMVTPKTDKHGYFLAIFTPKQLGGGLKPTNCKVTLKSSPSHTCKIATNINLGKTGAPLTHSRTIDYNKNTNTNTMELYSVPAFVYTSTAKCDKA